MGPDAERNWQAEQRRLDQELTDRWRGFNTEAEITRRLGPPDEDPVRTRVGVLLVKAWGTLYHAVRNGYGYADVAEFANDALRLRPSGPDAPSLRADALALRAAAWARLGGFAQAAEDAEAAAALDPDAGAWYGVPARRLLRVLRGERAAPFHFISRTRSAGSAGLCSRRPFQNVSG
jgi:hypothetical protein